jgi:nucleoside-triphosphatase THEP1
VAIVDEVGRWELAGGGLASAVRALLASPALPVLLVRDPFVNEVVEAFAVKCFEVLSVEEAR